jgi:hypothetical protein
VFAPLMKWLPDGPECIGTYKKRVKKCKECADLAKCKTFDPATKPIHGVFIDSFAALSGELETGEGIDKRGSARG